MFVQAAVRFTARPFTAAPAWLMLLLLATRLSALLDGDQNNVASISDGLPRVLVSACERSLISGALWRLRNHPVSEAIVAKSSLLTQGDVYSVSRIAELGNNIGIGFQHMLNWLETLSAPQQVYVWKLFAGAEATQTFLSKFQGAEQLYGEGTAQRVLQRLKFVLLDGRIDIPSTVGVERLLGEAMGAYKAAFFTFAGELSQAISRTDIVLFEKKLQDHLPLLKEVLAGILSLCVRLDDNQTKEYRTTLGRWLLKLFRLDSAALLLSPLTPAEQILERKMLSTMGGDARGNTTTAATTAGSDGGGILGKQPRTVLADTLKFNQHQSLPLTPQHTQRQQPHQVMVMPQFSRSVSFSSVPQQELQPATAGVPSNTMSRTAATTLAANGGDSVKPASLFTFLNVAKQPMPQASTSTSSTYPTASMLSTKPGMTAGAKVAPPLSGSTVQPGASSVSARIRSSDDSWASTQTSKIERGSSSMREQVPDRFWRGAIATQNASSGPGTDTLTSMAAVLRAEAARKSYSSGLRPGQSSATATAYSTGAADTYALDGYMLDAAARRTAAAGRTVSDESISGDAQRGILDGTRTATARGLTTATAVGLRGQEGRTHKTGGIAPQDTLSVGEEARVPSGYTMHHLLNLAEEDKQGPQGKSDAPAQLLGRRGSSSAGSVPVVNALRSGSPLSAGELKTRLLNMDKVMQTSKPISDSEVATGASGQATGNATQRQTPRGTFDTTAAATAGRLPPLLLYGGRDTSALSLSSVNTAAGLDTLIKSAIATGEEALATTRAGTEWGAVGTSTTSAVKRTLPVSASGGDSRTVATSAAAAAWGKLSTTETAAGSTTEAPPATVAGGRAHSTSKAAGGYETVTTLASTAGRRASSASAVAGERQKVARSTAADGENTLPTATSPAGRGTLPMSATVADRETLRTSRLSPEDDTPGISAGPADPGILPMSATATGQGGRATLPVPGKNRAQGIAEGPAGRGTLTTSATAAGRGVMSPSAIAAEWERLRTAAPAAGRSAPQTSAAGAGWKSTETSATTSAQETLKNLPGHGGNGAPLPTTEAAANETISRRSSAANKMSLAEIFGLQSERGAPPASATGNGRKTLPPAAARGETLSTSATTAGEGKLSSSVAAGGETRSTALNATDDEAQLSRSNPANEGKLAALFAATADRRTPPVSANSFGRKARQFSVAADREETRATPAPAAKDAKLPIPPTAAGRGVFPAAVTTPEGGAQEAQSSPASKGSLAAIFTAPTRRRTPPTLATDSEGKILPAAAGREDTLATLASRAGLGTSASSTGSAEDERAQTSTLSTIHGTPGAPAAPGAAGTLESSTGLVGSR